MTGARDDHELCPGNPRGHRVSQPSEIRHVVLAGHDEYRYLHCAQAGQVDYLVTRDLDLLEIGSIDGIPILDPPAFLAAAMRAGWDLDP